MKCNDCEHKSEEDEYNLKVCITCDHNPYVITDMFKAKEIEIRPENPGELWVNGNGKFYHTAILDEDLYLSGVYDTMIVNDHMDFKKWTRLYPDTEELLETYIVNKDMNSVGQLSRFYNGHDNDVTVKVYKS